MGALSNLYATTIGKKVVMALSGVVLFGFAIVQSIISRKSEADA